MSQLKTATQDSAPALRPQGGSLHAAPPGLPRAAVTTPPPPSPATAGTAAATATTASNARSLRPPTPVLRPSAPGFAVTPRTVGLGHAGRRGAPPNHRLGAAGMLGAGGMLGGGMMGDSMGGMRSEMTTLHTGEVFVPAGPGPTLGGHRWDSATMTTGPDGPALFPEAEFATADGRAIVGVDGAPVHGAVPMGAAGMASPLTAGSRAPPAPGKLLFPPPPPPMLASGMPSSAQEVRMMRWFQTCEGWCVERVADNRRVIVAPPPRPPPFTAPDLVAVSAVAAAVALPQRGSASVPPYTLGGWHTRTHAWWAHVARHFEKLRTAPIETNPAVSRGGAHKLLPEQVLSMIA